MNVNYDPSPKPTRDIARVMAHVKRMLMEIELANRDQSQISAKPLAMTLLLIGLVIIFAGFVHISGYFGTDTSTKIVFVSNSFIVGIVLISLGIYLSRPKTRVTVGVKIVMTACMSFFYFAALWLNGSVPGLFIPVMVVILHLIWAPSVSLVLSLFTMGWAGFVMLHDPSLKPAFAIRILMSAMLILFIMQILIRRIASSYYKSLHVADQLAKIIENLDSDLEQSKYSLETVLRTDTETGLMNVSGFESSGAGFLKTMPEDRICAVISVKFQGLAAVRSVLTDKERGALLKILSQRLFHIAGPTGLVGRSSTSDFLILVPLDGPEGMENLFLVELSKNLMQPFQLRERKLASNPHIGISFYPADGRDMQSLRHGAEVSAQLAMAKGKRLSRYSSDMYDQIHEHMMIASGIDTAIAENQLLLEYQPVVGIGSGQFDKVEALIRWNHPELGRLPPSRFIHIMDDEQLVGVTDWVLNAVKLQLEQWLKTSDIRLEVAVNIPAAYLKNRSAENDVCLNLLRDFDNEAGSIILEVTESSLFEAGKDALAFIAEVRKLGLKIAMDDFGTGFANLSQLESLPLDLLKIDKSLVDGIGDSERKMALCGYIIRLGHELGLKVVAEGIETERQRDALIWAGCDYGQGYLFSKPLPAERIPEFFIATAS